MANTFEYILKLTDGMSAKLKGIGASSDTAMGKIAGLNKQGQALDKGFNALGRSVSGLQTRIDALRAQRDLLPASSLGQIRAINREIDQLERDMNRLQTTGRRGLGGMFKDAMSSLPGGSFLMNPVVAVTAGIGAMTTQGLRFDEGMAKINITAQLSADKLAKLKAQILEVGKAQGADPGSLTTTFEKILSQVGDVDTSMKIFQSTLKGSKAGFTDASIVADALAQSLSAIGAKNASAAEVLDTLFAAKRVGAGEFADYAKYVPGLIAGGQALGVGFKEVAGMFSYMTAKGNSAERSATLMQNAFTSLGKGEIQKGLAGAGINIFDKQGNMRAVEDIFSDLGDRLKALGNDAARSNFLEQIGLRDAQAKQAFMILTGEVDKLRWTLDATRNATGETSAALDFAQNPLMRITEVWNRFKTMLIQSSEGFVSVVEPLAWTGNLLVDVLEPVLKGVSSVLSTIIKDAKDGKPLMLGLAAAFGAYAIATKGVAAAHTIATVATGAWGAAMTFLNAAFALSPIGLIVIAVGVLVAVIARAWKEFEWFRNAVKAVGQAIKDAILWVVDRTINQVKTLVAVFEKLFSLDFKGAWKAFTEGPEVKPVTGPALAKGTQDNSTFAPQSWGFKGVPYMAPGVEPQGGNKKKGGGGGDGGYNSSPLGNTAESIATGGTRTQNFNISIGKLIERFTVENHGPGVDSDEIQDRVLDALMRALNMSQSLANG